MDLILKFYVGQYKPVTATMLHGWHLEMCRAGTLLGTESSQAYLHVCGVAKPPLSPREAVLPLRQQKPGVSLHAEVRQLQVLGVSAPTPGE